MVLSVPVFFSSRRVVSFENDVTRNVIARKRSVTSGWWLTKKTVVQWLSKSQFLLARKAFSVLEVGTPWKRERAFTQRSVSPV